MHRMRATEHKLCNEILDVLEKYTSELEPELAINVLIGLAMHLSSTVFRENFCALDTCEKIGQDTSRV